MVSISGTDMSHTGLYKENQVNKRSNSLKSKFQQSVDKKSSTDKQFSNLLANRFEQLRELVQRKYRRNENEEKQEFNDLEKMN